MTKAFPYVLSCDWFAFSCLSTWAEAKGYYPEKTIQTKKDAVGFPVFERDQVAALFREVHREGKTAFIERRVGDVITFSHYEFRVCESLERHINYNCAVRVVYNGIDICHLFYSEKRNPGSNRCIAKVANSLLYTKDWPSIFTDCLRACGWRWVAVNRLDLCCDFNYFANGRLPALFVNDYLRKPTRDRPSFIRRGSNKWRAVGERTIKANMIDTLSWGTRDSPVQVNLYNKTKELLEVHNKPWIQAKWEQNGLKSGKDDAGKMHYVWRVEFSLNPSAIAFRKKDRSSVIDVKLDSVCNQGALADLFSILLPRYFQFYYVPAVNCPARVRDLQPVVLFDSVNESDIVPMTLSHSVNSGRTERLISKRLRQVLDTQQLTEQQMQSVMETARIFDDVADMKTLKDVAPADDVLYQILVGVRTWNLKEKPYRLTAERVQRQALRLAHLIMRGRVAGAPEFDMAVEAFQECVRDMRSHIAKVYQTLPDEYYNEGIEDTLSPYDLHAS